jgi:hypothetical protein
VEVRVHATDPLYDDIYSPKVVMARVGHLDRTKRRDIERITRIIRESFNGAGMLHPKPKITKILLIGPYARRTWTKDDETPAVPTYDFWIIVNDRLFTHKRLWQSTKAEIAQALGDRCTVSLSFTSARGVSVGKQAGDEFVVDRLNTGITLYRAKRDAPVSRRGKGVRIWTAALARFGAAEASFLPACTAFRAAERAYFAACAEQGDDLSAEEDEALQIHTGLDRAISEQKRLGELRHEAAMALLHTSAPDLAAIIRKLELVRDDGDGDDHATISILADLRWLAARQAAVGTLS